MQKMFFHTFLVVFLRVIDIETWKFAESHTTACTHDTCFFSNLVLSTHATLSHGTILFLVTGRNMDHFVNFQATL